MPAIGARGGGRKKEEMREHEGKIIFFLCTQYKHKFSLFYDYPFCLKINILLGFSQKINVT